MKPWTNSERDSTASDTRARRPEERTGLRRLNMGATAGIAAGVVGLVLPIALVLLAAYEPAALVPLAQGVVQATTVLALIAALLFAISLLLYRRGFAALRAVDPRFWSASALCILGSLGFILLLLAAGLALASSDSIAQCVHGAPTRAPACLLSTTPRAAYSGAIGLVLVWLGGIGIVVGLSLAGRRFARGALYGGAAAYALLLLALAGPLIAVLYPIAGLTYAILAAPLLVLLAPALVSAGSRGALQG